MLIAYADADCALWKKAHERNAKRVFNLMVELEGLWVKLGQYLSSRADVLPSAFISNLKQLQNYVMLSKSQANLIGLEVVYFCPKLKALPDYIYQSTTLEELQIYKSAILEEQFKEGGKGWPNTSHTPNITLL
ncbi:hypothetical protein SADUNF_SadunfUnG0007400 [Salix dunnii]|uniref:Uncharacterized protein n=1 Tax=Salix dunnii TaxID=1413687 RepID=A0A835J0K4_9ROSI|nr:hypothetical protein SADUNF_SadunfUnG0007400 [Salix dunnii]